MKRCFNPALFLILCFFYSAGKAQQPGVKPVLLPWHENFDIKKTVFSADGQYLVTTGDDHAAVISDLKKRIPVAKIPGIIPDLLIADPSAPFFYTLTETKDSLYLQKRQFPSGSVVHSTPIPKTIRSPELSMPRFGYYPLVDIDFSTRKLRLCYNEGEFSTAMPQQIVEFSAEGKILQHIRGIDHETVNAIQTINGEIWVATSRAVLKQKGDRFEKMLSVPEEGDLFANMQFRNDTLVLLSGYLQWFDIRGMKLLDKVSVKDFFALGEQDYQFASRMRLNHSFVLDEAGAVWLTNTRRQQSATEIRNRIYYVAKINKGTISYPLLTSEPAAFRDLYKEVAIDFAYCPATGCFAFIEDSQQDRADIVLRNTGHLFSLTRKNISIDNFYLTDEPGKLLVQVNSHFSDGVFLDLSNGKMEPVGLRKDYHINTARFLGSKDYKPLAATKKLYSPARRAYTPAGLWQKGTDLRMNIPGTDSCRIHLPNALAALNKQKGEMQWYDIKQLLLHTIKLTDDEGNPVQQSWKYDAFSFDSSSSILTIYWESQTTSLTKLIHIIKLDEKKILRKWRVRDLLVLPGGKQFVTGHGIFQLADSTQVTPFPEGYSFADRFVVSPDKRYISFIMEYYTKEDELVTWDNSVKKMAVAGSQSGIEKITADPHSSLVYTLGRDEKIKVWDAGKSRQLAEIVLDANRGTYNELGELQPSYLVLLPDGNYMGENKYYNMLSWTEQDKEYPAFQMDAKFHRPDKVLDAFGYADSKVINAISNMTGKRARRFSIADIAADVVISGKNNVPYFSKQSVNLSISLEGPATGVQGLMIYVNGTALWPTPGKPAAIFNSNKIFTAEISLVDAGNHIRVCLTDKDGKETPGDYVYVNAMPEKKKDLYFVGIGLSQYNDPRNNLRYAAKDMLDIYKYFKTTSSFENVHAYTSSNERVSARTIDSVRLFLQKARARDQVIVYYAGHGMLDTASGSYYLSSYNWEAGNPAATGLNIDDLNNAVAASPARKKIMMIDACNSGLSDDEAMIYEETMGDDTSAVVARGFKVKNKSQRSSIVNFAFNHFNQGNGVDIMAASAGNEYAFETDSLKNGLFTYSLLTAFKSGDADLDKDSILSISELQHYVSSMVKRLSKGRQQPSFRQANLYQDIAMLSSGDSYFAAFLWAAQNNHLPTLKICLEQEKIPVNKKDERGFTALHYACRQGAFTAVKYLLEKKADMSLKSEFPFSCLYLAAINRHEKIVYYLLDKGAVVKEQVDLSWHMDTLKLRSTPFILSMLADFKKVKQRESIHYEMMRFLASGNVLSADSIYKAEKLDLDYWHYGEGISAVFVAIFQKKQQSLEWLVNNGVNINYTNESAGMFTPLMAAAYSNNLAAAQLLVKFGADKRAKDRNGNTALLVAIQNGSTDVEDFLNQ